MYRAVLGVLHPGFPSYFPGKVWGEAVRTTMFREVASHAHWSHQSPSSSAAWFPFAVVAGSPMLDHSRSPSLSAL